MNHLLPTDITPETAETARTDGYNFGILSQFPLEYLTEFQQGLQQAIDQRATTEPLAHIPPEYRQMFTPDRVGNAAISTPAAVHHSF